MSDEHEAELAVTIYVDIPNPATIGQDDNAWMNVHTAPTKTEAVAWIRDNIGDCDDDGRIGLLSNAILSKDTKLTERQKRLLVACVDAELANNRSTDTALSLDETEGADDPDAAVETLQKELMAVRELLSSPE